MYSSYSQAPTGPGLAIGGVLTAASEIAVMTSEQGAAQIPPGPQGVVIRGVIWISGGVTGGTWTIKCRRGAGIGGAQVGVSNSIAIGANGVTEITYTYNDPAPPASVNGIYTITVTAAGSNGTFNDGGIEVMVPAPGTDV